MTKSLFILLLITPLLSFGQQEFTEHDASNPVLVQSRVVIDAETYFFENGSVFYALRPGFYYGLKNDRHQVGLSIPYFHNVFNGDYGGFENTSGIGDIKMTYMYVPVINQNILGLERLSTYLEVSAPTGEYQLGRGSGVWMYKPAVIFSVRASPAVSFYPEVRYQFSANSANSGGGSDGIPDSEDPDKDGKVQNLTLELPAVVEVEAWHGWIALHAQYIRSFTEQTNFFYMRFDIGKMMGKKASGALNIQKFISGQPRLDLVVQARFQFFLK